MGRTAFRVESRPTFREKSGRFARATEELLEDRRDIMRGLGRRLQSYARQDAPKGKSGKFRGSIRWRSFAQGDTIGFTLSMLQPLGTFIQRGTKPHIIAPRRAGALFFPWPKVGMNVIVPKGGGFKTHVRSGMLWIGKGHVNHPGTKANPFLERAVTRWRPESRADLRRISTRFRTRYVGK